MNEYNSRQDFVRQMQSQKTFYQEESKQKTPFQQVNSSTKYQPVDQLQPQDNKITGKDYEELDNVLKNILVYPNQNLKQKYVHSTRLGDLDLKKSQKSLQKNSVNSDQKPQICPSSHLQVQKDYIPVCTDIYSIKHIGPATFLFFHSFRYLSILICVLLVLYGIYAFTTNIVASQRFSRQNAQYFYNTSNPQNYTQLTLKIALSAKIANPTDQNRLFYYIQCWIGVGVIIIWTFLFIVIRYIENKEIKSYYQDSINISNYSVVMEDVPLDITKQELQSELNTYYHDLVKTPSIPQSQLQPFNIVKIDVGKPYYLQNEALQNKETQQLQEYIEKTRTEIIENVVEDRRDNPKFTLPQARRQALYRKYDQIRQKKDKLYRSQAQKLTEKMQLQKQDCTTDAFVTLDTTTATNLLVKYNQFNLYSRLRGCCVRANRFVLSRGETKYPIKIQRAPQPYDIRWQNIGRGDCQIYCRKLITYPITLVLLGISFATVYGLNRAQDQRKGDQVFSFAISIVIVLINVVLGLVIKYLTLFQKEYIEANRQASLAVKSIIAQSINTIAVPVIVSFFIKKADNNYSSIYATGGLAQTIFLLGVLNSFFPPFLAFLNPAGLITIIKRRIKSRPTSKLYQTQKQYNQLHQGFEFEIGYEYIYAVNSFLFACYFISLQPIVSAFALLGNFLMYWAQKYNLFNRYRRPSPSSDFINKAVYQMVCLGPLLFSLGNITWSNLDLISGQPQRNPYNPLVPNLISIGFSIFLLLFPLNEIMVGCCFESWGSKKYYYRDQWKDFPSQYDRLNPITSQQAYRNYRSLLKEDQKQLKKASEELQKRQLLASQPQNIQPSYCQ